MDERKIGSLIVDTVDWRKLRKEIVILWKVNIIVDRRKNNWNWKICKRKWDSQSRKRTFAHKYGGFKKSN